MPAAPKRLWIIDPSVATREEQGIRSILEDWPGESRLFFPALDGDGPGPDTGYDTDGVVLMGSASSPHDDLPWSRSLGAWIDPVLRGEVVLPLFGICYGHQFIAHRAGGEVQFMDAEKHKRLGVEESHLDGGRLLPGQHELRVAVSHREQVTRAPDDFRVVARRSSVPCDGLEHCLLPIFSFQFHPEARDEFAKSAGFESALIDPRLIEDSRRLLGSFRALVKDESNKR